MVIAGRCDDRCRSRDLLELNPVLPIVLHTGNRPWTANRELSQLMAGPQALRDFSPHWPLLFWDVAEKTLEDVIAHSQQERRHQQEVQEMAESVLKSWDDILAEGIEQGIEQGELRTRRTDLKRLLERDFPNVSSETLDRIDAIDDPARLEALFDQALNAKSLDELGL